MASSDELSRWQTASDDIIICILSFLGRGDRFSAALTCKHWNACINNASLWKHFTFRFNFEDANQLNCVEQYGRFLKSVKIYLNPQIKENVDNAVTVIQELARCSERRLQSLLLWFTEENPLFFQGKNIIDALAELFGPPDPAIEIVNTFKNVNLGGLSVAVGELLIKLLASNNPDLEVLNIQNTALTCNVSPLCLVDVVKRCRKLKHLSCFSLSSSDDLLRAFLESNRDPVEVISFMCRREDKFHVPVHRDTWSAFVKKLPKVKVSLLFDHTIEQEDIDNVLQPAIPLVSLSLRTMCELHKQLELVDRYYSASLERLEIATKGTDELQQALLRLLRNSSKLNELHCLCGLSDDTLREIKKLKPNLKKYTLKTEEEFRRMNEQIMLVGRGASESAIFQAPGVFENMTNIAPETEDQDLVEEEESHVNLENVAVDPVPERQEGINGDGEDLEDTSENQEDASILATEEAQDETPLEQVSIPDSEKIEEEGSATTEANEDVQKTSSAVEESSSSVEEGASSSPVSTKDIPEELSKPQVPVETNPIEEPIPERNDQQEAPGVFEEPLISSFAESHFAAPEDTTNKEMAEGHTDQQNDVSTVSNNGEADVTTKDIPAPAETAKTKSVAAAEDEDETTTESAQEKSASQGVSSSASDVGESRDHVEEIINPDAAEDVPPLPTDDVTQDHTKEEPKDEDQETDKREPKQNSPKMLNIALAVGVCTVAVVVSIFIARSTFSN